MKNIHLTGSMLAVAAATLITTGCSHHKADELEAADAAAAAKIHCNGVNECKGHGACASANNACAGHNECKGQGFVELNAEDCAAQGGTAG